MTQQEFREKYEIHPSFKFNGRFISFHGKGQLVIGEGSYIGNLSTIQIHADCKVLIGRGCSISHNVRIHTSYKMPDGDFSNKEDVPIITGNVVIQDFVWIGANVFISPGVTIGRNSVIGANSMVTKDVPENCIYGGVPARLIRVKRSNA